jgi:hypothetical protein
MDKKDLYALDEAVIQEEKQKKDDENKAYFNEMEKDAEMMKSVQDCLQKEKMKGE